jgi:hypothetical protein
MYRSLYNSSRQQSTYMKSGSLLRSHIKIIKIQEDPATAMIPTTQTARDDDSDWRRRPARDFLHRQGETDRKQAGKQGILSNALFASVQPAVPPPTPLVRFQPRFHHFAQNASFMRVRSSIVNSSNITCPAKYYLPKCRGEEVRVVAQVVQPLRNTSTAISPFCAKYG